MKAYTLPTREECDSEPVALFKRRSLESLTLFTAPGGAAESHTQSMMQILVFEGSKVVACGFPKLPSSSAEALVVEASEKEDGEGAVIFVHEGRLVCLSRRSESLDKKLREWYLASEKPGISWLSAKEGRALLVEIVFAESRGVVPYEVEGAFLLGATEVRGDELVILTPPVSWPRALRKRKLPSLVGKSLSEARAEVELLPWSKEGAVVLLSSGDLVVLRGSSCASARALKKNPTIETMITLVESGASFEGLDEAFPSGTVADLLDSLLYARDDAEELMTDLLLADEEVASLWGGANLERAVRGLIIRDLEEA